MNTNMASNEKTAPIPEVDSQTPSMDQGSYEVTAPPPTGWMYKSRKCCGITLPYYASPKAQLLLVSFVCFLCPGRSCERAMGRHHGRDSTDTI